tara:strand:- start:10687 stop:11190 length:504 start_codon:yes stop_codon:yes gene_type:complete
MYETRVELESMQNLLDESYQNAGKHLLSIHQDSWRLSAIDLSDMLRGVCVLNLATINRVGAPIVAPVDGLFLAGKFWFGSAPESRRFAHIRRDNRVSASYTVGEEVSVVVHGHAHEVDTRTGDYEQLHDYCRETYGAQYDEWGYWGNAPFAWIEANRMYAIKMSHRD